MIYSFRSIFAKNVCERFPDFSSLLISGLVGVSVVVDLLKLLTIAVLRVLENSNGTLALFRERFFSRFAYTVSNVFMSSSEGWDISYVAYYLPHLPGVLINLDKMKKSHFNSCYFNNRNSRKFEWQQQPRRFLGVLKPLFANWPVT